MLYGIAAAVNAGSGLPPGLSGLVRFDASVTSPALERASTTSATTPLFTLSMWMRASSYDDDVIMLAPIPPFSCYIQSDGVVGGHAYFFAQFNDPAAGGHFMQWGSNPVLVPHQVHHIYMACDSNHATGAKLHKCWVDGIDTNLEDYYSDSGAAFSFTPNTRAFAIPDQHDWYGPGQIVDYAEVWMAWGQYLDPATNIQKFRDPDTGGAVDLGIAGATPTGTSPTYYFSGNAASFATNRGTGGAVTLHGSLSDV